MSETQRKTPTWGNFKQDFINSNPLLRDKVKEMTGTEEKKHNPFLKKNGDLVNPYIDYQQVLNDPNVTAKAKEYITEAIGATPVEQTVEIQPQVQSIAANSVGQRIANTVAYNNDAAKGQCVWYVRGRASEKLGKDTGAIGNANQMWYNAKADAKLSPTAENIKPDVIVSYKTGTGSGGQTAGHVIYIEDVVGDTVYYTEGGSGYYKNGTDGVVKTASKQGILQGVNTNGARMGSGVIGFIDLSKY